MGRGKRREAIAELLRAGVARLEQFSSPWLLQVTPGSVEENSECLVFVTERVLGTLATIIASQHGTREMGAYKKSNKSNFRFFHIMYSFKGPGSRNNSLEHNCSYTLIDFEFRWGLSQARKNIVYLHD